MENSLIRPLYLDDLSVGQRFTSDIYEVTEAHILEFASQFDPQPFHLDDEQAKQTLFRGLAASGWHTAALTMRLLVAGGLPFGGGIIGAGAQITWPSPTRPGDILHVESEITEIVPMGSRKDQGIVSVLGLTLNQRGETVQKMTAKLVVGRKSAV